MGLVEIAPGESISEHDETGRDQEEVFVVLSGSPTMVIDGDEHAVPAGTFVRVDPAHRRTVVNHGAEPASVLIVGAAHERLPADGLELTSQLAVSAQRRLRK